VQSAAVAAKALKGAMAVRGTMGPLEVRFSRSLKEPDLTEVVPMVALVAEAGRLAREAPVETAARHSAAAVTCQAGY
jgi:hypothetical protein